MRREGRAIRMRIIAGRTVQMISISWESKRSRLVSLVITIETMV